MRHGYEPAPRLHLRDSLRDSSAREGILSLGKTKKLPDLFCIMPLSISSNQRRDVTNSQGIKRVLLNHVWLQNICTAYLLSRLLRFCKLQNLGASGFQSSFAITRSRHRLSIVSPQARPPYGGDTENKAIQNHNCLRKAGRSAISGKHNRGLYHLRCQPQRHRSRQPQRTPMSSQTHCTCPQ